MIGNQSGNPSQFNGEFAIAKEVYEAMEQTASSAPRQEIGGMLFGSIDDSENEPRVNVEQVVHLPPEGYSNSSSHFEIDPTYSSYVVDEYSSDRKYLGNWHSHLGYGGPSSGDHQQVADFFGNNDFRDYLISIIMDRQTKISSPSYSPIAEVYRNKQGKSYDTWRVNREDLVLLENSDFDNAVERIDRISDGTSGFDDSQDSLKTKVRGLGLKEDLEDAVLELVDLMSLRIDIDSDLSKGLAYTNSGSGSVDTAVLAVPIRYSIKQDPNNITDRIKGLWEDDNGRSGDVFAAFLTVEAPYSCPEGDIYIDLATRDLTKQLTVKTISSSTLVGDKEELITTLKYTIETHIPELLQKPLITVLQDETEWSQ